LSPSATATTCPIFPKPQPAPTARRRTCSRTWSSSPRSFSERAAHVDPSRLELGAALFFWSRLAYFPVYLAGIPYVRTALWAVAVVGMAMILWASVATA